MVSKSCSTALSLRHRPPCRQRRRGGGHARHHARARQRTQPPFPSPPAHHLPARLLALSTLWRCRPAMHRLAHLAMTSPLDALPLPARGVASSRSRLHVLPMLSWRAGLRRAGEHETLREELSRSPLPLFFRSFPCRYLGGGLPRTLSGSSSPGGRPPPQLNPLALSSISHDTLKMAWGHAGSPRMDVSPCRELQDDVAVLMRPGGGGSRA